MSFNTTPTSSTNNLPYMGIQEQNPRETYIRRRDPTVNDYRGYKLGDRWINKATGTWCTLVSKSNAIATWLCISGTTFVNTINGCSGAILLAGGIAIDVVSACPTLTIDVRVDGITIGVNGANQLEVIPSGILDSLQFDPDVGVNVSPVGAILQVPGIGGNQTLNGGAGILQFNNRRWLSAYVVDPSVVPGLDGEYTTIQAAINAAFAAGGGVVYVRQGTYVENLTLEPTVELIGVDVDGRVPRVIVQGNHTMSSDGVFAIDDIQFDTAAGDSFTLNNAALGSSSVLLMKNCNVSSPAGRCFVGAPAVGASAQFALYEVQGGASLDCFDLSEQSGAQLEQSFFFSSNNCMNLNGNGSVQAINTRFNASNTCFFFANNLHGLDLEICQCFSTQEIINFSAAGSSANARHCTFGTAAASTFCVTGVGTFEYADLINSNTANIIDPAVTQSKLNWQPYGEDGLIATAYRGTAAFDDTQFVVTDGFVQLISPGAPVTTLGVDVFTPPGTDPVVPDGLGNIDVTGAQVAAGTTANVIQTNSTAANQMIIEIQRSSAQVASTVGANGVSHFDSAMFTVDANGFVQLAGGSIAIDAINVDAFTPPGTDPVVADGTGQITVTGAQVAAGTTANVIQTNSLAANTYAIEIQRSSAQVASTIGANGVSHFDSAQFTVDANGFVQIVGGAAVTTIGVDVFTPPGTDPVVPNGSGTIDFTGAQIASGSTANVIRTNSTAANQTIIEIQRASAQAVSTVASNGVSHYDSADFTVDANGFVSLVGTAFTSIVQQSFSASGTYTPTASMKYCVIEAVGGGGAGGGADATGAAQFSVGGGGGGGGYSRDVFTAAAVGASQVVTIGAGGTGVSGGTGNTGGTTTVGALVSATGGLGGAITISLAASGNYGRGGASGTGTIGGTGIRASRGDIGVQTGVLVFAGNGGTSIWGQGGEGTATGISGAGNAGNGRGGGGGGSGNGPTQAAVAGGNGTDGFVVITEYI